MSQPRTQEIELTRGDDFGATVTFDQLVSGFSEIRFTVRETWATGETDNSDAKLSKALTPTGAYTAEIEITSAESLTLEDRSVYDIQVVTVGGKKYTTQRGQLRVSPDVTR